MRWPIRLQLLLPILLIVVVAVVAVSATSAWLVSSQARRQQEESVERLSRSIAAAPFPPTKAVLHQMSGLSGAEFVLFDHQGRISVSTLLLDQDERASLFQLPASQQHEGFAESPVLVLGGRSFLAERLPVTREWAAIQPGSLAVLYPEGPWRAAIRQGVYPVLVIGLLSVAVVVLITTALAGRLIARIRRLGDQTASIAGGNFTPVPIGPGNDEIRDLAVSINRMTEQLSQYESEVRQNERLRTLGQLGAAVAHQLRNSATGALMAIELHQQECPMADGCESLPMAVRQLRLMESYLQRFLTMGPTEPSSDEEVILEPLVKDVLELVQPACTHAGIDVTFTRPGEPLRVRGDTESLRQMLVNLVVNAVEAAGRPTQRASSVAVELERQDDGRVRLTVKDSGPGPAAATKDRLFEPFVTDKPDGTGLGLSVARQIAESHHGAIRWERQGRTTAFTVELPLWEPRADHGASAGS